MNLLFLLAILIPVPMPGKDWQKKIADRERKQRAAKKKGSDSGEEGEGDALLFLD